MENVLVIEDDESIRSFMRRVLTRMGYVVKVAQDGEEGIELYNKNKNFDLVITGIRIPGKNGNEVAAHIRNSERPRIPLVAMTGSGKNAIQKDLFDLSLMKPFKLQFLLDGIRSLTQSN